MAGSRTLKLSILADVDDLRKKLSDGENTVDGFGSKLDGFASKAGAAFLAAGAAAAVYAGKLLVDGVQAAIEDEKAQARLAGTLERAAGASKDQVAAVEAYISKTSLATGITDDKLRPAFERLTLSTKDVAETQKLLPIAMDIAAAKGMSLDTVVNGLAKAYDGNTGALNKLGLGFETADLKGKSLNDLMPQLIEKFGGAAQEQADTFAGKMDRLKNAFSEGKETVGSFVLDAITPLVTLFVDKAIPVITELSDSIGEKLGPLFEDISDFIMTDFLPAFEEVNGFIQQNIVPLFGSILSGILSGLSSAWEKISGAIDKNKDKFKAFYDAVAPIIAWVADKLAPIFKTTLSIALSAVGSAISFVIDRFGSLAGAVANVVNKIKDIIDLVKNNPIVKGISGLIDNVFGGGKATGGFVTGGTSYLVGERGPELFIPNTGGTIVPNNRLGGSGSIININVQGAIDPESTARQIIDILNSSVARGGASSNAALTA